MRSVLFHNVVTEPVDAIDRVVERMHVQAFRRAIDFLRSRYRITSLPAAMEALERGEAEPDALVLTFDDGYANVLDVAQPVLAEHGLGAAVFVLTDGHGGMPSHRLLHFEELEIAFRTTAKTVADFRWLAVDDTKLSALADRARALRAVKKRLKLLPNADRASAHARVIDILDIEPPTYARAAQADSRYRKLDVDGCRKLHDAGWTIGGHTLSHPSLRRLESADLLHELEGNARDLAALGFPGAPFAYPYGGDEHVDARVRDATARVGFSSGWTTIEGDNDVACSRFAMRRFSLPALTMNASRQAVIDRCREGLEEPL